MYSKCWLIIRDDTKRTFEIVGLESNTNHFMNNVHGMQKAGMNVSCLTPPVTNKTSSKDAVKVVGYTREVNLHERLSEEYKKITRKDFDQWEGIEL
jgi:hypothetical protein